MQKKTKQKKTSGQRSLFIVLLLVIAIFTGRLLQRLAIGIYGQSRQNPLAASGVFVFLITFGFVAYNALFSQSAYHRTPLFETRALPETQVEEMQTASITPPPPVEQVAQTPVSSSTPLQTAQITIAQLLLPTGAGTPVPAASPLRETTASAPQAGPEPSQELLLLQKQMTAAGFYSGPLDGLDGPKTRAAIAAWKNRQFVSNAASSAVNQNRVVAPSAAPRPIDQIITNALPNSTQPEAPAQSEISQVDIFRVQAGLRLFGYNFVAISGVEDDATNQALRAFQKLFSLKETGRVTPEVIKKMREIGIFG